MNIIKRVLVSWIFWICMWILCIVLGFFSGECLRSYYGDKNGCSIDSIASNVTDIELSVAENE